MRRFIVEVLVDVVLLLAILFLLDLFTVGQPFPFGPTSAPIADIRSDAGLLGFLSWAAILVTTLLLTPTAMSRSKEARALMTVVPPPTGLERVVRVADDGTRYLVAINHAETGAVIDAPGTDVATGATTDATTLVPAGATRVIRLAGVAS